jgi:thiol-disulfide isomerase/thioredoxin
VNPRKAIAIAAIAALLGGMASLFVRGPGVLLRSDVGQTIFERLIPPKYSLPHPTAETVLPFTVSGFDGKPHTLPVPGQWQVINYWASWCQPCRQELPWLEALHAGSQGHYAVIGIALDTPDEARMLLRTIPVRFPQYYETPSATDSSVQLGNAWGLLPFTVLINPQGRLIQHHLGPFSDQAQLHTWLQAGIASSPSL